MSFNQKIYGGIVSSVATEGSHDYNYLCNQLAKLYREINDQCTDNWRICRVIDGKTTHEYEMQVEEGCCGFADTKVTNPLTGNAFSIGCNYGH